MKKLSLIAGLLVLSSSSFAGTAAVPGSETFGQELALRASADKANITKSVLNASLKNNLMNRLDAAMTAAKCAPGKVKLATIGSPAGCPNSTPTLIEAAQATLTQLETDFAAAVKTDGKETIVQIYKPKTDALTVKINAAKIDAGDKTRLQNAIKSFTQSLSAPAGKAPALDAIDAALQKISDDVDAAIKLSGNADSSKGFQAAFQARAAKFQAALKAAKVPAAVAAEFTNRYNAIVNKPCFNSVSLKTGGCADSVISAADDALTQLSSDLDAATKADSGKTLAQLYQPKLDALTKKLNASKLAGADKASLAKEIAGIAGDIAGGKNSTTGQKVTVDGLDARVQKASDDLDAAIALLAENGGKASLAAGVTAKAAKLGDAIKNSKLSPAIQLDFNNQVRAAMSALGCAAGTADAAKCGTTDSKLEAADQKFDDISTALAAAIKADGTKSLAQIYQPKADALTKKIAAAKIDSGDAAKLTTRVKNFIANLSMKGGPVMTPEKAADSFSAISDDLDAAIELQAARAPKKP